MVSKNFQPYSLYFKCYIFFNTKIKCARRKKITIVFLFSATNSSCFDSYTSDETCQLSFDPNIPEFVNNGGTLHYILTRHFKHKLQGNLSGLMSLLRLSVQLMNVVVFSFKCWDQTDTETVSQSDRNKNCQRLKCALSVRDSENADMIQTSPLFQHKKNNFSF